MKLKTTFSCVLFLAVTFVSCKRPRNELPRGNDLACKLSNRQLQIYRPQGLMVKQLNRKYLHSMDLEMYINRNFEQPPDIYANATVSNSTQKWVIIKHPSAVILPGDTVLYGFTKHYRYGSWTRFYCEFKANGDRMKFLPKAISPQSCPSLRPKIVPSSEKRNYAAEKTLLEDTINDLLSPREANCTADFKLPTKQLILTGDYTGAETEKALKRYVVDRLNSLLPTVDWHDNVEKVYRSQERIVFEVKSVLMKLKILRSIRGTDVAKNIIEFEEPRKSANEHDQTSEDYGDYDSTTEVVDV